MGKKQSRTSDNNAGRETVLERIRPMLDKILGRPLKTSEEGKEKLSRVKCDPAVVEAYLGFE